MLYKCNRKAWMTVYLFATCFTEYVKYTVNRKNNLFLNITAHLSMFLVTIEL